MSERSCSLAKFCWSAANRRCLACPTVAGASVAAEVLQHKRGPKVISFKKRRRKNSKRKRGYRDEITVLRITEILTNDNKPTVGPRPKREKEVRRRRGWRRRGAEGREEKAPAKKVVAKERQNRAPSRMPRRRQQQRPRRPIKFEA